MPSQLNTWHYFPTPTSFHFNIKSQRTNQQAKRIRTLKKIQTRNLLFFTKFERSYALQKFRHRILAPKSIPSKIPRYQMGSYALLWPISPFFSSSLSLKKQGTKKKKDKLQKSLYTPSSS